MSTDILDQKLQEIEQELSHLGVQFEAQMKAAGFTLENLNEAVAALPVEVTQAMEKAHEEAKRSGAARATQSATISEPAQARKSGRKGIVNV